MTTLPDRAIVVGIDGSAAAHEAARWAARLGEQQRRPVVLLHAGGPLHLDVSNRPTAASTNDVLAAAHRRHHELVEGAAEVARQVAPGADIRTVVTTQGARASLLRASEDADVLVLGSRRDGRRLTGLLGTVTSTLITDASCPVVVTRSSPSVPRAGVVVGVDGTRLSAPALAFAASLASVWREPLLVVHCYWPPSLVGREPTQYGTYDEQRLVLGEQLAGLSTDHPDLVVRTRIVEDFADRTLVDEAATRRLLVVGHRPHGAWSDFAWGTLAPAVLRHADADVAVVPPPARPRPRSTSVVAATSP